LLGEALLRLFDVVVDEGEIIAIVGYLGHLCLLAL
jgi:hypothetical protein